MSANVFPLVSIMQNITKTTLNRQIIAKKKNAAAFPTASTTEENDTVTMNASIQFKHAALEEAVPFSCAGKISPM